MTASTLQAAPSTPRLSEKNYVFLQKFIYNESGIVIDADKQYLLDSRLQPLVSEAKLDSLNALSELLATRPTHVLGRRVVDAMTTNETLFFRDRAFFDALKTNVFPELFKLTQGRKLRIWSAASSTGQEAYSLAMLLLEMGKLRHEFEIVGTDICTTALERARAGRYTQFEVNRGLPAPFLMKYFTPVGTDWQLNADVRSLAQFSSIDLRQNLFALGMFDLILCRNVLIYFDDETKQKIFANLGSVLRPHAYLALGCAESMVRLSNGFERTAVDLSSFYRLKGN
jgi:chemotaxis protein methyltransferase CheR